MITNNTQRIKQIKRLFYPGAVLMALAALAFILAGEDLPALIIGIVLIFWFLVFQLTDFQYIEFGIEENKLFLRYYPAVKFGRKEYQTIEFPVNTLHDYVFEKSFFGLVRDLTLVVRTRRGIAEYPSVSLAAVSKADQLKMEQTLREILHR
jgi:hypothetical protein